MLGYGAQLQDPEMSRRWVFAAFEVGINEIWDSACVTMLRDDNVPGHQLCTELQERVAAWATRSGSVGLNPGSMFEKYVASVRPEESLMDRVSYCALVALTHLWQAKDLQGSARAPNVEAAICLMRGMSAARTGDDVIRRCVQEAVGEQKGADDQRHRAQLEQLRRVTKAARASHANEARDRVTVYKRFVRQREKYSSYNEAAEHLATNFQYTARTIAGWLSADDKEHAVTWTPPRRGRRRREVD